MRNDPGRRRRRLVFSSVAAVVFSAVCIWLLIALRGLILPCAVGALLAYITLPLIRRLRRMGVPKAAAIGLLFLLVIGGIGLLGLQVYRIIPDETGALALRTRVRNKMCKRYVHFMGLDKSEDGNRMSKLLGPSVAPIYRQVNAVLRLSAEEADKLRASVSPLRDRVWRYHQENLDHDRRFFGSGFGGQGSKLSLGSWFSRTASAVSLWVATPFVFLFLLFDDSRLKFWLASLVPNRYFELSLTLFDNVDDDIGRYLRGTFLQCAMVGLTFSICLFVIGFPFGWALAIGTIAGVANAIPFLGPLIGFVAGGTYALIAENVSGVLPYFDESNLVIGVILTVALVQLLDNTVFQPIILGGAVNLHPLVVVLGVMGGSILFGFWGMLFALPVIVVIKVVVTTTRKELVAYRII